MKYSGTNIKALREGLHTKSLLATLSKFGLVGAKGYPTPKGKKFMTKISHSEVSVIDADGLIEYVKQQRAR
jgi:hypothetical protein